MCRVDELLTLELGIKYKLSKKNLLFFTPNSPLQTVHYVQTLVQKIWYGVNACVACVTGSQLPAVEASASRRAQHRPTARPRLGPRLEPRLAMTRRSCRCVGWNSREHKRGLRGERGSEMRRRRCAVGGAKAAVPKAALALVCQGWRSALPRQDA